MGGQDPFRGPEPVEVDDTATPAPKRRPGRPKGSKAKPKPEPPSDEET